MWLGKGGNLTTPTLREKASLLNSVLQIEPVFVHYIISSSYNTTFFVPHSEPSPRLSSLSPKLPPLAPTSHFLIPCRQPNPSLLLLSTLR